MAKILVVDDQKDIVDSITSILENQGFSVEKAYDGKECLERINENDKESVKLVFLDIMMPGINGYEVAKQLKGMFHDNIKIVYVSIKPKAEVHMGEADGFIQKPFGIGDIIDTAKKFALAR